jgi:hypothetical protein
MCSIDKRDVACASDLERTTLTKSANVTVSPRQQELQTVTSHNIENAKIGKAHSAEVF